MRRFLLVLLCSPLGCALAQTQVAALADLSLEELADVRVTSVSGRAERLGDAPASIYVISNDDIRRSGATSLAQALRLAPTLNIARIDASQYAISARGFNNAVGNKLLVLIDGRTVYTPLFSGVFWDQQDVMLEDVERIEVITGPGAVLWGANAVNGVINVITREARDTLGTVGTVGGGSHESGVALRHGARLGANGHFRVYAKGTRVEASEQEATGITGFDARDFGQAGFRADWSAGRDAFTLQGDAYTGQTDNRGAVGPFVLGRVEVHGANLLGRWTRSLAEDSDLRVQAYYDQSRRQDAVLFQPDATIFDLEAQHSIRLGAHRVVSGGGYRYARDFVQDGFFAAMRPQGKELDWMNVFVQDEIELTRSLAFTAGIKFERNDYTGWEYLPSLRLAWKAADGHLVWAAASRAVRAPSRFDREVIEPLFGTVAGGPNFESEVAEVYELGWRGQLGRGFTASLTAFHHEWDSLRSGTETVPIFLVNDIQGPVYGFEGWAAWQVARAWKLSGGFMTLRKHLEFQPGTGDPAGIDNPTLANDPEFQWSVRSSHDVGENHELDLAVRRVGRLPNPVVPEYTALDIRWGWRPQRGMELSATLRNALDPRHPEFGDPTSRFNIERALYLAARWVL